MRQLEIILNQKGVMILNQRLLLDITYLFYIEVYGKKEKHHCRQGRIQRKEKFKHGYAGHLMKCLTLMRPPFGRPNDCGGERFDPQIDVY